MIWAPWFPWALGQLPTCPYGSYATAWMNSNKLLLNPSKTEFLLIGTKQQRLKFSQLTTSSLGNDIIPVSSSARNLGFIFDSDMSFTDQINSLSKSCHFYIRDIRRIRHLHLLSAATALANSLASSKIHYCNSPTMTFRKLTWTKYSAYKILWLVSLQIHQNLNTLHQYSKNYIGFQSNNASITNYLLTYKTLQRWYLIEFFEMTEPRGVV